MRYFIPNSILKSEDFLELNEQEKNAFVARCNYLKVILDFFSELESDFYKYSPLNQFLSDLELEISTGLNYTSKEEKCQISNWFVHDTWISPIEAGELRKILGESFIAKLDNPSFSFAVDKKNILLWLKNSEKTLEELLVNFSSSEEENTGKAFLLAIDIYLSKLLFQLYQLRLCDIN